MSTPTPLYADFEVLPDEAGEIHIPFEISGIMTPKFPRPVPPTDLEGLPDPTTAPVVTKSTTDNGTLLPGTYRYSYAAWRGTGIQATAPSPYVEVVLTTENTVNVTCPPIPGADGYLVYREDL